MLALLVGYVFTYWLHALKRFKYLLALRQYQRVHLITCTLLFVSMLDIISLGNELLQNEKFIKRK